MHPIPKALALCFFAILCLPTIAGDAKRSAAGKAVGAEDVRNSSGLYSVVFYYLPDPAADPRETAKSLVEQMLPDIPFVDAGHEPKKPPFVVFEEEKAPLKTYDVPDPEYLKYFGRDLTAEEVAGMQKSSRATALILVSAPADVWRLGRTFSFLSKNFAEKTKAILWDDSTREGFSPVSWKAKRLDPWPEEGLPPVASQVTIHAYRPEGQQDYARLITLGMEKFALPDIVIPRITTSDSKSGGSLINLVCQSLAQNPKLQSGTKEVFSISAILSEPIRKAFINSQIGKPKGEITLALLEGKGLDGDPDNRLLELDFRHGDGSTENEKLHDLLVKLWGAQDSIMGARHSEDILAASSRAKAKLPQLNQHFGKGLDVNEHLLVKAPFARDDEGEEWMWVEVQRWPANGDIDGILENDPFFIKKLQAGASVHVKTADVFDYILKKPDGTQEGNETDPLIEKQGGEIQRK